MVLKKLAKFHAATVVMKQNDDTVFSSLMESTNASEEETPLSFFFSVSMMETLETIKNVPELEKYFNRLEAFDVIEQERKIFRRSADEKFHVLNHGDLWLNNIFLRSNGEGEPEAVMVRHFILHSMM